MTVTAVQAWQAAPPRDDLYERVGQFLLDHRLGPDPVNYAFAHSVVSDPEGALAQSVLRIAEGGFRLTGQDVERLGCTIRKGAPVAVNRAPPRSAPDADGLIARAQVQVDGFADTMRTMQAETRDFGADLAQSAAAIDAGRTLPAIDEVVRMTSAMIARVRESEVRLEVATREADALRVALDDARGSARRDPLTDLPNRRAFQEAYAALEQPAVLAICDIDHFKAVNDRFGHGVGDRVLRAIAQALVSRCDGCLVSRYGGEEFVILASMPLEAAERLIDGARADVAAKRFRLRDTDALLGTITFSAGLAQVTPGDTADDALARADLALYAAKGRGRNRLVVAPTPGA